jgi:hypothetical protein
MCYITLHSTKKVYYTDKILIFTHHNTAQPDNQALSVAAEHT